MSDVKRMYWHSQKKDIFFYDGYLSSEKEGVDDVELVFGADYDALLAHNEALQEECDRLAIRPDKMASEITKLTEKLTYRDNQLEKALKLLRDMVDLYDTDQECLVPGRRYDARKFLSLVAEDKENEMD